MNIKNVSIVIGVGLLAIAFLWMKGISQITGRDVPATYVSSSVPAPTPGQKKIVLKNLGMT